MVWCFTSLRQERSFRKSWHVLIFLENFLTFVTLKLQLWIYAKFQGVFYICSSEKHLSFKAFLCSSLWSLSSSTLQSVMVTQSFLQKVSTFCYLPRSKHQEEFILLCLVVQKERLEVAAALCRLLAGWRGKMQEKLSPADGEMRMGILYLWVFLAVELQWVTQKGKAGVGVKATGRGWQIAEDRQEKEMLKQTGSDKTVYLQVFPDIFLFMWRAFCLFVLLCFSPAEAGLALLPVWSEVCQVPTHPWAQPLSCPLPSAAPLV